MGERERTSHCSCSFIRTHTIVHALASSIYFVFDVSFYFFIFRDRARLVQNIGKELFFFLLLLKRCASVYNSQFLLNEKCYAYRYQWNVCCWMLTVPSTGIGSPRVRTTFQDYYWFRRGHKWVRSLPLLTMRSGEYLLCMASFFRSIFFSPLRCASNPFVLYMFKIRINWQLILKGAFLSAFRSVNWINHKNKRKRKHTDIAEASATHTLTIAGS